MMNDNIAQMAKEEDRKQDKKELMYIIDQKSQELAARQVEIKKIIRSIEKVEYEIFQRVSLAEFDKLKAYIQILPTADAL
jgi:hypothetical protein